ncbi:cell division protein ZapE [uncultured Oxalicibacterium sp.]|uniref:cell division protein ZapE n=1 Tax=uncultured Oxalicibacterium sp. TaxID=1168540 RepID=UPI0025DE2154|nr:cell division protein ZapE [uncultured Oxalicibacterium sp.]
MNVAEIYEHALNERGFTADDAQRRAVLRLQQAYEEWESLAARKKNIFTRLLGESPAPRGLYMWGGVGRGKSFLMDSFYSVVPMDRKMRIHFHEFMRSVHRQLDELKQIADPLEEVAKRVAAKYRLICFDEFHVTDIADAMILYNLFKGLFDRGVSFIVTSNFAPDDLYPDGLHRDRILPAIDLIKERLDIMNVDGGLDYRKRALSQVTAYHTPLDAQASEALRTAFMRIAEVADEDPLVNIEGREVRALRKAGGVIWFDFHTLCGGPRSQNDYLELASRFHTLILSDVPAISASMSSEARRFIWLIDVLYDHRIKLLISAAVPMDELYTVGGLSMEFQRTLSRLIEMQSDEYMEAERRRASGAM